MLVGIVGGIGSGKSVVSHILTLLGHEVYDCDINAKILMNTSATLQEKLKANFGDDVINESGEVNRAKLSNIIFNDADALLKVNSIVHPAVVADLLNKAEDSGRAIYFFETALPHESGLDSLADEIWHVTAPVSVRVERVISRNNMSREQVESRINSQNLNYMDNKNIRVLRNDGESALLPQIINLLNKTNHETI